MRGRLDAGLLIQYQLPVERLPEPPSRGLRWDVRRGATLMSVLVGRISGFGPDWIPPGLGLSFQLALIRVLAEVDGPCGVERLSYPLVGLANSWLLTHVGPWAPFRLEGARLEITPADEDGCLAASVGDAEDPQRFVCRARPLRCLEIPQGSILTCPGEARTLLRTGTQRLLAELTPISAEAGVRSAEVLELSGQLPPPADRELRLDSVFCVGGAQLVLSGRELAQVAAPVVSVPVAGA